MRLHSRSLKPTPNVIRRNDISITHPNSKVEHGVNSPNPSVIAKNHVHIREQKQVCNQAHKYKKTEKTRRVKSFWLIVIVIAIVSLHKSECRFWNCFFGFFSKFPQTKLFSWELKEFDSFHFNNSFNFDLNQRNSKFEIL